MALKPPVEVPQGAIRLNTDSQKLEFFAQDRWWVMATDPSSGVASRVVWMGKFDDSSNSGVIDYNQVETTGNSVDFGDLLTVEYYGGSCASKTRGFYFGGEVPITDTIQYVEFSTTGNATDFGNLTESMKYDPTGVSDNSRGIRGGGASSPGPGGVDTIDYWTMSSTGNAVDFGNLTVARRYQAPMNSPTRGIWCGGGTGGNPSPSTDTIDYITIQSTGNAVDFGDTSVVRAPASGCSSSTRGLFAGGYSSPAKTNSIEYITIASTGNGTDFGDLINATSGNAFGNNGNIASSTRGIFYMGGVSGVGDVNTIQYVTMTTLGNALDFGDLTRADQQVAGGSNSHGGLS